MYEEIVHYRNLLAENPEVRVHDELANMLITLARKITHKKNFRDYSELDDWIMSAVEVCLKALPNYDLSRRNPYGYFTSCIHNEYINQIKKLEKQKAIKLRSLDDAVLFGSSNSPAIQGYISRRFGQDYDDTRTWLFEYDEKQAAKKKKKEKEKTESLKSFIGEENEDSSNN